MFFESAFRGFLYRIPLHLFLFVSFCIVSFSFPSGKFKGAAQGDPAGRGAYFHGARISALLEKRKNKITPQKTHRGCPPAILSGIFVFFLFIF